jgi:D-3-phosphoglycerate dehydrogenase
MNVLISTSSFAKHSREPLDRLEGWGASYRLNPHGRKLTAEEIAAFLADVDGLIAGTEPLTRDVLRRAPRLRAISRCGTGLDNVDLEAAAELGIEVRNTPEAHVDGVAELALAGMIGALRKVTQADRSVRSGEWKKPMGRLLRGKTVGLIGLGRVGKRLVELLAPFEVMLLASDPGKSPEFAARHGIEYTDLDDLLARADVVSLHLPYAAQVHHLLDCTRIERMKPDAVLVNCARGGIVDEDALYEALREGRLAGAHFDCFEREPYDGPLSELPNVVLTSHIGSYAVEGRVRMEREAVENLIDCLSNGLAIDGEDA